MRAYTLSVLTQLAKTGSPMIEKEIVTWVNNKLQNANKSSTLKGFQDQALKDGRIVIDLIDAIKPGTINYDLVKEDGDTEVHLSNQNYLLMWLKLIIIINNDPLFQDNLANAKYAISMARKTGARVYALPEDITEVKPKMIMTLFACLMAIDYVPSMGVAGKSDS